ncbi:major capsid protein [Psychrobacillus sp.]|uniref:major capsid protein n=1 Tax=Psychrobacillus sp. TaxID=1871623 RepID=UPI0028BEEDD9|nr:major capsid protein [Psychrobacillus sp.]
MNLYSTHTLLKAVQNMPKPQTFLSDTFFPGEDTFLTEEVLLDIKKGKRTLAPFVAPRVGGVTVKRDGYKTERYTAPRLAPQRPMIADDLQARLIGESVVSTMTPAQRQVRLLASDMEELSDTITRRKEWMSAQVLFTGKVILQGYADANGEKTIEQEIDYEFTQSDVLSGTDKWTSPDSDPYGDIAGWRKDIIKESGVSPNILILGEDAHNAIMSHEKFLNKFNKLNVNIGQIQPSVQNDAITFIGKIPGLGIEIYTYDDWYLDESGDEHPFVPANKVLLARSKSGGFAYGAITILDEKSQKFVTYEGAVVPKTWADSQNETFMVRLSSRPVPQPGDVNGWYVATVV